MAATTEVLCSLVIATVDDDGDLAHCLGSLAACDGRDDFEVIVVDQNDDDHVAQVVAEAAPLEVTVLRVPWRGASRARNLGAANAIGQWLWFPDDDCVFPSDTLAVAAAALARSHELVVTGRTADPDGRDNLRSWPAESRDFDTASMIDCAIEAMTIVRRDAFLAAGGYDLRFGPGARYPATEGFDLLLRLDPGTRPFGHFERDLVVRHPTTEPRPDRVFAYAKGRGAASARHVGTPLARDSAGRLLRTVGGALLHRPTLLQLRLRLAYAGGLIAGFLTYAVTERRPRR